MSASINDINTTMYTPSTSATTGVMKGEVKTGLAQASMDIASLGKDDFLKLLLAQMKNQDPLNPSNNTEFVAQLAQFSSLEQMAQMNANLEKSLENNTRISDSIQSAMMINYLGKSINAEVPDFSFDGQSPVSLYFNTDADFTTGKIEIVNEGGDLIRTLNLKSMSAGNQQVVWDGMTSGGVNADEGNYTYILTAKDSGNEDVEWIPMFAGTVQGISYKEGKPYLYSGGVFVPFDKVRNITPES